MMEHVVVYLVCVPIVVGLGVFNTRKKMFTVGEIRFWGICIFIAAELVNLGAFS